MYATLINLFLEVSRNFTLIDQIFILETVVIIVQNSLVILASRVIWYSL